MPYIFIRTFERTKPEIDGTNSLPKYKFLDWSKLKAFADDKINVTEKLIFVL